MKKRLALIIVALLSVIAMSILLISCSENPKSTEPKVYTVSYKAGENGYLSYLDGDEQKDVDFVDFKAKFGEETTVVTACPNPGYMFVRWSDGETTAERREAFITNDLHVTAEFDILTRTYKLNYRQNSQTELYKPTVKWTIGELDGVTLPVLEKEHFIFDGWYYGDTKVADENGELLIDDDFLLLPELKLFGQGEVAIEAKWKAEETFTFKILLVYVTKIEADLLDGNRNMQHVEFQMTDVQKQFCHENTKLLKNTMDNMMDGLVNFEVDEYFTTQTVYTESFIQGFNDPTGSTVMTRLYPSYIPEITTADMTEGYDVSVSVLGFCEGLTTFEDAHRFQYTAGQANSGRIAECQVNLDNIWYSFVFEGGATSIEEVLQNPNDYYLYLWSNFIETFTHEITHTIEMRINIYDYHSTNGLWGINPRIGALRNTKMYYLNELILDGERIGIPYGFWKGEIANVTYDVSKNVYGDMGYVVLVEKNNNFITKGMTQEVVYGYDASTVLVEPHLGYRFVQWSDGVTTPERKDSNITADFTVTAIFEPIVYTINVVAGEGGGVWLIDSSDVQNTVTVQVTRYGRAYVFAEAQEGYRFVGWSDGTTNPDWSKFIQVTDLDLFDENNTYTLTAIFEKIE